MLTKQSLTADLRRAVKRSRRYDGSTPAIIRTLEIVNIVGIEGERDRVRGTEQREAA